MLRRTFRAASATTALAILGLATARQGRAQGPQASASRRPVTVALVDTLPTMREHFAAAVLRRPGPHGGDIVLLPRAAASGPVLDAATRALLHSRLIHGPDVSSLHGKAVHDLLLGVRGSAPPDTGYGRRELPLAQRVVNRLASAPKRTIPGLGSVPALDFYPPALAPRAQHH